MTVEQLRARLAALYETAELDEMIQRYDALQTRFRTRYGTEPTFFVSAPGRTELGGNHTDHNHGRVLSAAVSLDTIAAVRPVGGTVVRLSSDLYEPDVRVDLSTTDVVAGEEGTPGALIRGIAHGLQQAGVGVVAFDAEMTSTVTLGSGLSSSAAFEMAMVEAFLGTSGESPEAQAIDRTGRARIAQDAENRYFGKPSGLMDQLTVSVGGVVTIDFLNPVAPLITQLPQLPADHQLCVVDTRGSHADLTPDYAAVPAEMRCVASILGGTVLRDVDESSLRDRLPEVRRVCGDRSALRAIHFFEENRRVARMARALQDGDAEGYLAEVRSSGTSSAQLLQNLYSPREPSAQAIPIALAETRTYLGENGAARVHGGGFAGTIQAYIPRDAMEGYVVRMEQLFGAGAVMEIRPRKSGATVL